MDSPKIVVSKRSKGLSGSKILVKSLNYIAPVKYSCWLFGGSLGIRQAPMTFAGTRYTYQNWEPHQIRCCCRTPRCPMPTRVWCSDVGPFGFAFTWSLKAIERFGLTSEDFPGFDFFDGEGDRDRGCSL